MRLIGDPEARYREDPVRMLRAVRFAAKLGFRIEPATEAPIVCAAVLRIRMALMASSIRCSFRSRRRAAPRLPADHSDPAQVVEAAFGPLRNTAPFNSTHHPALSVPCGLLDGLPVGMMLVGRQWEETILYRAAYALEQGADWRKL